MIIKKNTINDNNAKIEQIIDKQEFDCLDEAKKYLKNNYPSAVFLFKLSRTGTQYENNAISLWYEKLEYLGLSAEIGFEDIKAAKQVLSDFNIIQYVNGPVFDFAYKIINRL